VLNFADDCICICVFLAEATTCDIGYAGGQPPPVCGNDAGNHVTYCELYQMINHSILLQKCIVLTGTH